ncbi:uncharacterized protein MELLADRAFT_89708 [Melampsora larici-populina 98AG31]|uniref:Uncharacterized protein n=1 Tax=Melampsora larici-populina (strain 98AG31 / pathotype 3-4-7) TaxID=747676 RepID=F4RUC2_MELLP|nr:uncharacterized protein MELLADRAFT_89708 [Melampsora larici-populina 98AG31]EGG03910.1 hypothetical protein MELLADRAFT_89708 [Melampsora larici-populina 98AG31]
MALVTNSSFCVSHVATSTQHHHSDFSSQRLPTPSLPLGSQDMPKTLPCKWQVAVPNDHVIQCLQTSTPNQPQPPSHFETPRTIYLGPKRVEDVKLNRIDKSRNGRRWRPSRRPFVFKSSPLAEGHSAGRLNIYIGTPFNRFSKITTLSRNPFIRSGFTTNLAPSSHRHDYFMDTQITSTSSHIIPQRNFCTQYPNVSSLLPNSPPLPKLDRIRQPLISRFQFSSPKPMRSPSAAHHPPAECQKWEISLPQCVMLNFIPQ